MTSIHLLAGQRRRLRGAERRWPPLFNPPGRSALHFRVGDHGEFFTRMERRLLERFPDLQHFAPGAPDAMSWYRQGAEERVTVGRLRDAKSTVPLQALLEVWAEVLDILSFYQERYLQEGFLRTAVEGRSLLELWRMVGYSGSPPIVGTAEVAVFIDPLEGLPAVLELPAGLEIHSQPEDGDAPQVFETLEVASVQLAKNRLVLRGHEAMVASQSLVIPGGTSTGGESLWLEGNPAVGDSLLLLGPAREAGEVGCRWFRQILEVEASEKYPNYALVKWNGPLAREAQSQETQSQETLGRETLGPEPHRIEIHRAMVQRRAVQLFGADAPYFEELPIEEQRRYRPPAGGVQLLEADRARAINGSDVTGIPEAEVRDLLWVGESLLVATAEGLMRSEDRGVTWQSVELSLGLGAIRCLSAIGSTVFAGSDDGGVFRSRNGGVSWDPLGMQGIPMGRRRWFRAPVLGALDGKIPYTLLLRLEGDRLEILAGTSEGVFCTHDAAAGWRSMGRGLPGFDPETGSAAVAVYDLIPGPRPGQFLAATSSGIYRWRPTLERWRPRNLGLPCTDPMTGASQTEAFAFEVIYPRFFVGTREGFFRSDTAGTRWERKPLDIAVPCGTAVRHLTKGGAQGFETLLAGTDTGLFESQDHGCTWQRRSLGDGPQGPVVALAGGQVPALATPLGEVSRQEWPEFRLQNGVIDLAETVASVLPGGWVVLLPEDEEDTTVEALEIQRVSEVNRRDFDLEARISRLEVDPAVDLSRFDLRRTMACVESEPFRLAELYRGSWKEQATELVKDLEAWGNHPVLVKLGHPLLALLLYSTTLSKEAPRWEALAAEVARWRVTAPWRQPATASSVAERLRTAEICYRRLMALDTWPVDLSRHLLEALGLPPEDDQRQAGWDLEALVDPEGEPCLHIFGNTAPVVEGVTHRGEVIGSTEADQPFQRFVIPRPLVWRQVEGFLRPDLEVRVDGGPWLPVPSFEGQGSDDRVYMLRRNVEGHDEIVFGDGRRGALPTAGHDNVVATYRSGASGQAVVSGVLTSLPIRPLGLAEVFNPYAGHQGRRADLPLDDRMAGALGTRSGDRIVSLTDYGDFVAEQSGVVRSTAWVETKADGASVVQLWVGFEGTFSAPRDPRQIADRLGQLRRRIRAHQHASLPFHLGEIDSRPVTFNARLHGSWDPERDLVELEGKIWQALQQRFGRRRFAIGKRLSKSEVVRVLQLPEGVGGVERVEMRAFGSKGAQKVGPNQLCWLRRDACKLELVPRHSVSPIFGEAP